MISVEVRSANGRPNASTPVTTSGTACTMRVLRRFLNSELAFTAPSVAISLASSINEDVSLGSSSGPCSSCCMLAVPESSSASRWLRLLVGRYGLLVLPVACSRQESPELLGNPDRPDQQIDRPLEKRGMIAFNPVSQEQQNPAACKTSCAPAPSHEDQENQPGKNEWNADAMKQFVPGRAMFVIVLSHVVRQPGHSAPPTPVVPPEVFGGDCHRGNRTVS